MKSRTEIKAELNGLLVVELRAQAKHALITGYSKMRKAELVDLLADERILNQKISAAEAGEASRARRSPLDACEHGTAPQDFCQGCYDTKPVYAAQVDKVRAMRAAVQSAPKVEIHTGGELHPVPKMPVPDFVFNLSRLLDDPLRKPDADLVKRTGLDPRMEDFVFFTKGALDLYEDMVQLISRQLDRGKDVAVLVLCRGGKHRSVAFGENLASHFEVKATHHHIDLPIVKYAKAEAAR